MTFPLPKDFAEAITYLEFCERKSLAVWLQAQTDGDTDAQNHALGLGAGLQVAMNILKGQELGAPTGISATLEPEDPPPPKV